MSDIYSYPQSNFTKTEKCIRGISRKQMLIQLASTEENPEAVKNKTTK